MAVTIGFNHVATVTSDLDRTKRFYADAFDAEVSFEMAAEPDHPRMAIIDLGGGARSTCSRRRRTRSSATVARRAVAGRSTTTASPSTR